MKTHRGDTRNLNFSRVKKNMNGVGKRFEQIELRAKRKWISEETTFFGIFHQVFGSFPWTFCGFAVQIEAGVEMSKCTRFKMSWDSVHVNISEMQIKILKKWLILGFKSHSTLSSITATGIFLVQFSILIKLN